jgi:hypothetical protein
LPSGTVIQANVTESYSLTSGKQLSGQRRTEDILVYQAGAPSGATAAATFPVTPSEAFQIGEVSAGNVHLDLLSGRESVRGQIGGNDAATVQSGDLTLTVAAGSLSKNTAISVSREGLDNFLPTTTNLTPLSEYNVDFSGQTLTSAAQLSVSAGTAQAGDNVFLVQVQRIAGAPYLVVVGQAKVNGGNLVTLAPPGLPGITQGGDFVFYKLSSLTGFVSGTVTTSSGPVAALVQTDGLPFVAFANFAGSYVIPALAGSVNLTASVPNTALAGSGSAQVIAGQTAAANLTLVGQIESAAVTPPNGAVGVPLTAEIDITSGVAFNQATVTTANVTLTQTGQGSNVPVPVRFVFSQGGTKLAVFPLTALQPSKTYTVAASGIANGVGGLIAVPTVSFTTQAITPPNFNTDALVFAMPDQNGNVAISAPANSFPAGTTILIVDQTNGVVLSVTVANDGSVSGQMPAAIDDILAVTITAPDKTTASFTRSKFVAPDGTTAIGPGGGTVTGPNNTAVIIPQGALTKGVTFKLDQLDQSAFPVLPAWQGLNFGAGLRVSAPSMPTFSKELKLAFPVPADAPTNAFYYVFRRITDNSGNTYFETIDHAFVQGTGASAQVVTASPPFCGYRNSYGNFNTVAAASFPAIISVNATPIVDYVYMWDITQTDPNQPGVASPGLVVGRALQAGVVSGQTTYAPVQGAVIQLNNSMASVAVTSDSCGTFTIFDPQFGGGTRTLTGSYAGQTVQAVVNEVNGIQVDDSTYAITAGLEKQYRNVGRVTLTFAPPSLSPTPQITIGVNTLDSKNQRQPIQGIVQSGVPLVITFATNTTLTVTGATINGANYSVTADTGAGNDGQSHFVLAGGYSSQDAGPYTITAAALNSLNPTDPVTQSRSFLVVAAGGGSSSVTVGSAPTVINSIPLQNARRVPTTTFPNVAFSEPVINLPANVTFKDADGNSPPVVLVGIRSNGTVANPIGSGDAITSLTVQPLTGLKYNEQYTLILGSGIVDQNTPPLALATYTLQFTTVNPQEIGSTPTTSQFSATRGVVIGQRVYLGEFVNSTLAGLGIIDISDANNPIDKGVAATFVGRAMDAAGQASSPVARCTADPPTADCPISSGGPLVAIAAGQPGTSDLTIPSNVWLYDVSNPDQPVRVGAVSATTSTTQDGLLLRIFVKDQFLYASTFQKGLQVIDLAQAVSEYQSVMASNPSQFGQAVTTEGDGFAMDAVVNTIPVYANNASAILWDVKAADFPTGPPPSDGSPSPTQTLVLATGAVPLVVADPLQGGTGAVSYPLPDGTTVPAGSPGAGLANLSSAPLLSSDGKYQLQRGRALALGIAFVAQAQGNSTQEQIAVVVGTGVAPPLPDGTPAQGVLAVVNMNDPKHPVPQGFVSLSASPTDVVVYGSVAVIGTSLNKILLVNITDPARPAGAGEIDPSPGLALGSNLTVTDSGLIISSSPSSNFGGAQTSKLQSACVSYRAQIKNSPPKINPISISPSGNLAWTVSGGVSVNSPVTNALLNKDGLVLTDVRLGRRHMAAMMSLPYFRLQRSNDSSPVHCELAADGSPACSQPLASGFPGRSQLMSYDTKYAADGTNVAVQAQYLIDQLDGDVDQDPGRSDSCILLTQRYEFYQEGLTSLEPFGLFPSAKFRPLISYQYFTDSGPSLESLTTAQRLAFDVNSVDAAGNLTKSPANDTMLACDPDPFNTHTVCIPAGLGVLSDLGMLGGNNPLLQEAKVRVIENGKPKIFFDSGRNLPTVVDNLHFNATPTTSSNAPIDEPGLTAFGCPVCVHVHWRWSSAINSFPFNAAIQLDPTFDNKGGDGIPGDPKIPAGSNQDVDVAILKSGGSGQGGVAEEHPSDALSLYQPQTSILPSALMADPAKPKPVFWYVATGHQNSDQFFQHGGGFGTFYVNRITVQNPSTILLNVEHTRDVAFKVEVYKNVAVTASNPPIITPILVTSSTPPAGSLAAGTDDLALTFNDVLFDSTNALGGGGLDVTITLTDTALQQARSPKYIWKRTFHFDSPSTQEP